MTDNESISKQFLHMAHEAAYVTPVMIRFLLGENLALKNLLHEKGILEPAEFEAHKAKALEILDASMKETISRELKRATDQLKSLKASQ